MKGFNAINLIAEERIIAAQKSGAFNNLPGEGKPLVMEDDSLIAPDLRMAYKILKNSGFVPQEIADKKEISSLTELLAGCPEEKTRISAIKRLKFLLSRLPRGGERHMLLEQNDEYYQKALAVLTINESRKV